MVEKIESFRAIRTHGCMTFRKAIHMASELRLHRESVAPRRLRRIRGASYDDGVRGALEAHPMAMRKALHMTKQKDN
jgi:hypothetical protein